MGVAKEKLDGETIEAATGMVSLFDSIPPKEMAKYQRQDNQISPIIKYVEEDTKPPKKFTYITKFRIITKIKSTLSLVTIVIEVHISSSH